MTSYNTKNALLHWFDGSKNNFKSHGSGFFFVSFGPVTIYANDKQTLLSKLIPQKFLLKLMDLLGFSRCFEMKSGQISFIPSVIFCASKILEKNI